MLNHRHWGPDRDDGEEGLAPGWSSEVRCAMQELNGDRCSVPGETEATRSTTVWRHTDKEWAMIRRWDVRVWRGRLRQKLPGLTGASSRLTSQAKRARRSLPISQIPSVLGKRKPLDAADAGKLQAC